MNKENYTLEFFIDKFSDTYKESTIKKYYQKEPNKQNLYLSLLKKKRKKEKNCNMNTAQNMVARGKKGLVPIMRLCNRQETKQVEDFLKSREFKNYAKNVEDRFVLKETLRGYLIECNQTTLLQKEFKRDSIHETNELINSLLEKTQSILNIIKDDSYKIPKSVNIETIRDINKKTIIKLEEINFGLLPDCKYQDFLKELRNFH